MTHAPMSVVTLPAALLSFVVAAADALAQTGVPMPPSFDVRIEQKVGASAPSDLEFRDSSGSRVRFGDLFGNRPAILAFVYFECPMLCTRVLDSLVHSLRPLELDVGEEFDVIVVSIDPNDGPRRALEKKTEILERYGRRGAPSGWHFLTGEEETIRRLAGAVGFRYRLDPKTGQYAHAAGVIVLTPQGRTARYLLGLDYSPRSLRLSLVEASEGRIGSVTDDVLLLCFRWDPASGTYGFAIVSALRLAGVATVVALGVLVSLFLVRERRRACRRGATP